MSLPGQEHRDPGVARGRAVAMAVVVALAFLVVVARLYGLQVKQGEEFRQKSQNNFFQVRRLTHERGEIADARGVVLVTNRPASNVYVTPAFLPDARRAVRSLGAAARLDRAASEAVLQALSRVVRDDARPVLLARALSAADIERLREREATLDLPEGSVVVLPAAEGEFSAYLDPRTFPSTTLVLENLRRLTDLDDEAFEGLAARVRRKRGLERYQEILVRRDVPPRIEGKVALQVQLGALPGVTVGRASARDYRFGRAAAHLLGYVNELSPGELGAKKALGYRLGDAIGRTGIEKSMEGELRGTDGFETVVVDSKGRSQRSNLASLLQADVGERVAPSMGNRVVLTVDMRLQQAAEGAFDGRAGSVVVLEVETGRLLAMTSTPAFDPNRLAGYFDPREKARLDQMKERRPWRFRAVQDYFAPGSTFKVVTALAALEEHVVTHGEEISCTGAFTLGRARFRCWKDRGHGRMNLAESLMHSCDVYYYNMGRRLGLNPIADMGRALGLGARTGIDLPSESPGIMPDEAWYEQHLPEGYTLGAAINVSIGQGAVSTTPLQLAVVFASVASGRVMVPKIVRRIERSNGETIREIEPEVRHELEIPAEDLAVVREGLRRVVNTPGGTAYGKRLDRFEVAGKTGTAQVAKLGADRRRSRDAEWKLRDHAWFAAYAPVDDPKVAVVVFNEHGGGGSSSAAPIAMKVIRAWADLFHPEVAQR